MKKAIVIGGSLRIRSFPSESADVLEILSDKQEVIVISSDSEWTYVKTAQSKQKGYVMSKYLQSMPEPNREKAKSINKPKTNRKYRWGKINGGTK